MSILASKKVQYLTFYIHLTDPALVEQYQAQYPNGVNRGPLPAADEFGAPWRGYQEPAASQAPFSWTPWYGDGSDGPFPIDRAVFTRHTGGFLGIGGTDVKFYWMGMFVLASDPATPNDANGDPIAVDAQAQIPKRRWVEGFESPGLGPSAYVPTANLHYSRDASRRLGGMGLAFRGVSNASAICSTTAYDPAYIATKNWERLYIRLRKAPTTGTVEFWRTDNLVGGDGVSLQITTTGQLAVYKRVNGTGNVLLGTVAQLEAWTEHVDHNAWVKLDILHETDIGRLRLYLRGALIFEGAYPLGVRSVNSRVGWTAGVTNDLYLDIDDWISSEIPQKDGVESLSSKDFVSGSSIRLIRPTGFSASHNGAAWGTGDYRVLIQNTKEGFTPASIGSTTALAQLGVDTNADAELENDPNALGVAAITVQAATFRGTNSGQLGYSLNGAAAVMANIVEVAGPAFGASSVLFTNDGTLKAFPDVTPIELLYIKGNDAVACGVAALTAQAELCGKFGVEDYFAAEAEGIDPVVAGIVGQHNAPYPRSPWSLMGVAAPPSAPYIVVGGTYVGNGTGHDLTFRAPVHFLWIRPDNVSNLPFVWVSTAVASHKGFKLGIEPRIVSAEEDLSFVPGSGEDVQQQRYRIRIAGNDASLNANGVTYQYIAVIDPGMRYLLAMQTSQRTVEASRVNNLINAEYQPEWAFIIPEQFGTGATPSLHAKGPEQAAATIASFTAAALANALTFGIGQVTTQAAFHALSTGAGPNALAMWRRHDGNGDTGEPGVVNLGSYVGDGTASRTINLAPPSGKRPLWAIVFGENGSGALRDPTHTGTNSSSNTGGYIASGITAGGIDQFSVGATLNANGVRYIYFVLFAGTDAGNNGWGTNGEYIPVEAWAPADGPWPDDPPEPGETPVTPPTPEIPDDITTDLTVECEPFSRKIVNLALSRIGVNLAIDNLATSLTQEATTARLHYANDVGRVLRKFPWPFATRYADLVLVAGSDTVPVNGDWQYAYRAPTNMAFGRRIVPQDGKRRAYDPNPIKFRIGADDTGFLIYCNERATTEVPLQLEYTLRMACPASSGDALFRSALAWAHAASLAPSLSRDADKAKQCEQMYLYEGALATATAANEQQPDPDGDASWIAGRN